METATDVTFRGVREDDHAALADIESLIAGMPFAEADMRDRICESEPERCDHGWLIVEQPAAGVVAYAWFHQIPWSFQRENYKLRLAVHPLWQRRGIGRALMDRALHLLAGRGARRIYARAREDWARSLPFLARYGFTQYAQTFESRLQVALCDLSRFADYAERTARQGVVITTLESELRRQPDSLPAIYQLQCTLDLDAPRDDPDQLPTPPSWDAFLATCVRGPLVLPDAYFLAKIGDMYVGESMLKRSAADPAWLHQDLTGVIGAFRGQGFATALKLRTVEYAQRGGYRQIQTYNSSRNASMLAINAKLGFVRQPAWIEFKKTLQKQEASAGAVNGDRHV